MWVSRVCFPCLFYLIETFKFASKTCFYREVWVLEHLSLISCLFDYKKFFDIHCKVWWTSILILETGVFEWSKIFKFLKNKLIILSFNENIFLSLFCLELMFDSLEHVFYSTAYLSNFGQNKQRLHKIVSFFKEQLENSSRDRGSENGTICLPSDFTISSIL